MKDVPVCASYRVFCLAEEPLGFKNSNLGDMLERSFNEHKTRERLVCHSWHADTYGKIPSKAGLSCALQEGPVNNSGSLEAFFPTSYHSSRHLTATSRCSRRHRVAHSLSATN